MIAESDKLRALTIACPVEGCRAAVGCRCQYTGGVVGMVERDEPHSERLALAPKIGRLAKLISELPEIGQPFTAEQRGAILRAAVLGETPSRASAARDRILAHGGAKLGVPASESHPRRSARDHLAAARRHIDRAFETTDCDAIDPDSNELHATCALGRIHLAVEILEARRG